MKNKNFSNILSKYNYLIVIALMLLLLVSIVLAVSIGSVKLPATDVYSIILNKLFGTSLKGKSIPQASIDIVWQIRLPRVFLGVITGLGLSLGGTVMQATVQNPLADPYLLGISSGATLGATFSILIGASTLFTGVLQNTGVTFWAFIGALLASIVVFKLSNLGGRATSVKLVLSGMVVNLICSALSSFMIYLTNDNSALHSLSYWSMGSLTGAKWTNLLIPTIIVVFFIIIFIIQSRVMDVMLLGDETAITLGIDLNKYRKFYLISVSILSGVLVSCCGMIGFVGLVIPHITRSLVGSDHKKLLPTTVLLGAIFLVWADVLSRIILKNMEMPIGIITSLLGAPFFIYIMITRAYGFGER
ncbi:FecCD family ABC transporter permease [Clostridium senegalense]|uniref:FecCD family ABC transporter permease n=1 Tax=Clostridium senegalense TaxID=1465809 RepID=UPI001C102B73|nr:iron ABC transporter permease [Clostridium senegalense]MBU5227182.1 iron ABC transporter permease [Clostridium senegalense]